MTRCFHIDAWSYDTDGASPSWDDTLLQQNFQECSHSCMAARDANWITASASRNVSALRPSNSTPRRQNADSTTQGGNMATHAPPLMFDLVSTDMS